MFKKENIYEACKNTINKFKKIDDEDFKKLDPVYNWIQADSEKIKAKIIIEKTKRLTKEIIDLKNINDQKKKIKTIILNEVFTSATLTPVTLFINPENQNELIFNPLINFSQKQKHNYLKWIFKNDPLIKMLNITNEIDFLNASLIIQNYSVSTVIYSFLKDCLVESGDNKINDRIDFIKQDIFNNVLKLIPLIDEEGNLDSLKISDKDKMKTLLSTIAEKDFIENE